MGTRVAMVLTTPWYLSHNDSTSPVWDDSSHRSAAVKVLAKADQVPSQPILAAN